MQTLCTTHVPRANLLYSPRNKILATSLLIEHSCTRNKRAAFPSPILTNSTTWRSLHGMHRCLNPCPSYRFRGSDIACNSAHRQAQFQPDVTMSMFSSAQPIRQPPDSAQLIWNGLTKHKGSVIKQPSGSAIPFANAHLRRQLQAAAQNR